MQPHRAMIWPGLRRFAVDQGPHVAEYPLFRVLPDGAGVDDDHVRPPVGVRNLITHFAQHTPQQLGVGFVLLAAVGVHIGQGRGGQAAVEGAQLGAVFLLARDILRGG